MYLSRFTKCISIVLCALLLCTLIPLQSVEAAVSGLTVNVESVAASAGQQVVVPVKLANVPAKGISTADMTITYDPSKLEYISGEAGSIVTNPSTNFGINKEKDGTIKILFLDYTLLDGYISKDGVFVNLTFKVLSSATVTVSKATFGDSDLSPVTVKFNAGAITVGGGTTSPTPTPSSFAAKVESVTAKAGEQVVVPVKLVNVPTKGISTADMTITYDPTKLEYISGEAGSIVTDPSTNFGINKEKDGTIKILFLDYTLLNGYISKDGVFVNLTFKALGTGNVTISKSTFGDSDLSPVTVSLIAGTVTVDGGSAPATPTPVTPTPPTPTPPTPTAPPVTPPPATSGFAVNVESVTAKAGEQVVVPVKLANIPAKGISTADMTITYDPTKLEYISGEAGSIVTDPSTNFGINKEKDGTIKVLFLDYTLLNGYISKDGVFVNLTFKALGTGTVTISKATFGDTDLSPVTVKLNAGTVTVEGGSIPATPTAPPVTPPPATSGFAVNVESVTAKAGEQVVVPVKLVNVPTKGISTADMTITYDPTKLEYVSGEPGSIVTDPSTNFGINKEKDGTIKVLFLDYTLLNGYISKDGVFVNLTFKALGTGTVTISKATFGDTDLKPVTVKLNAGTVTVDGGGTIPTPTPTPITPTPPVQTGDFSVNYTQSDWGTGATVTMVITNNGSKAVDGWTVNFNFAGNQKITNSWNCSFTQNGNAVSITNASYNGVIPAGGSVIIGFNISYSGTNTVPTNFVVSATSSSDPVNPTPPPTQNNDCVASYTQSDWGTGATVNITIKNNGSKEVNGWTVNFSYAGNQKITNAWNCDYTQNGNSVTLKNTNYNGTIPPGGTLTIGFNISYTGNNSIPTNITVK